MHISNGWGLLYGLLGGRQGRSRACATADITIRRLKGFDQSAW
jgi:hypothetical protein